MVDHHYRAVPSQRQHMPGRYAYGVQSAQAAQALYRRARRRALLAQLWRRLTSGSQSLLDLAAVEADYIIRHQHAAGLQAVRIAQVQGSVGRVADFDASFRPLQEHTRERWIAIATLWLLGMALPPVRLVQAGDVYFVVDGHHRMSVARMLGATYIDADVTVWDVMARVPAMGAAGQPAWRRLRWRG